jgi:hypothetical protein
MSFVVADRVKETSLTTGTGSLVLGAGNFGGFQTFSQGIGNGNNTYYAIENYSNWEVGVGAYSSDGNTLSRDTILASSNSDNKVILDGVSIVFVTYPANKALVLDDDDFITGFSPSYKGVSFPDGTRQTTAPLPVGHLAAPPDGSAPLTLTRSTAGNLLHSYVDNSYDKTVGLHINTSPASNPTWKLGFKSSPSSFTEEPNYGYAYGKNGSAGIYSTTSTGFFIHDANGFWIRHNAVDLFNVVNSTSTSPTVTVKGVVGQSSNLQEWRNSSEVTLISVNRDGAMVFDEKIDDLSAPKSAMYYSSTKNKLVFKDDDGSVHSLY